MIELVFPDGAKRSYDEGVTPLAVAEGISKSLAKKVVAAKIDGAWWDLTRPLEKGGKFELVVRDSADGLEVLRHDAAHVLAQVCARIGKQDIEHERNWRGRAFDVEQNRARRRSRIGAHTCGVVPDGR